MKTAIAIAIAGALGALARYGVGGWISRRSQKLSFPWETFVVNISGAFALGLIFTAATEHWSIAPWLSASALTIGFLGAYTTFSTLMFETYRLGEDRAHALAALNILGSCVAGLVAVYLGVVIGRAL